VALSNLSKCSPDCAQHCIHREEQMKGVEVAAAVAALVWTFYFPSLILAQQAQGRGFSLISMHADPPFVRPAPSFHSQLRFSIIPRTWRLSAAARVTFLSPDPLQATTR